MTETGDAYLEGLDAIGNDYFALKTLNAELLAALILMENWASLYQVELDEMTLEQYEQADRQPGLCWREIKAAGAVIAKAKELDQ